TLPYLTYLSIFSYEANADGTLRPINDAPLIAAAKEQGVQPMLVLTNLAEAGGFNSDVASAILQDTAVQERLLNEVQAVLEEKGYYGLDIDFEYVYENERALYNAFLERVAARFGPLGYRLTSAVAPKLSDEQQGRLYTAHDYAAHGRLMDAVIIMTYEWGYLYGPPLPVSPIGPVEQVIQYAVSEIPPQKILMGMPNYAYDWTLPYQEGVPARSITNQQALDTARRYGANIQYDEEAQAPFFTYYDAQGREHIVWFEDARSDLARLRLVEEYGLAGVSYWTIGNFFLPAYLALTSLYTVRKV
ncbi:MAG: glycosyl hydrolase family 18 protein, partial [Eubacteriales bacterium]|nr:glycosyl hydrolase family 18 protein [Eubacteriales bacterium]